MLRLFATTLFSVALSLAPALAQAGPTGMAWVQAPEMGGGVCFGSDARQAIDCAVEMCVDDTGLEPEDCIIEGWCSPSRWTGDIFVQHAEGPHWHSVQCGWSTREKLEDAVKLFCAEDYFIECQIVRLWDPDGVEQKEV